MFLMSDSSSLPVEGKKKGSGESNEHESTKKQNNYKSNSYKQHISFGNQWGNNHREKTRQQIIPNNTMRRKNEIANLVSNWFSWNTQRPFDNVG